MPEHGRPSPSPQPSKRQRQSSASGPEPGLPISVQRQETETEEVASSQGSKIGQSSNFRNVSACNRCRLRKNRCDQKLPSCATCAKAGVACVGYDPITKKEIPRSYVFYLETRIAQLETLLSTHEVDIPPAEDLEPCSRPGTGTAVSTTTAGYSLADEVDYGQGPKSRGPATDSLQEKKTGSSPAILNIVSANKPRSLASASGVSFARVVFAAVQHAAPDQPGAGDYPRSRNPSGSGTSMRDSFFGLHTKPKIKPAPFPDKETALNLVTLYFEYANPQIPILHRGEFMQAFESAYSKPFDSITSGELYILNMVFAIGCGVIVGEPIKTEPNGEEKMMIDSNKIPCQPEEYHASAIVHLESCLSSSGEGLEVLQAVLLLANFALLRPVPPGLWYIIGVATRLAVDLGLHTEDNGEDDNSWPVASRDGTNARNLHTDPREKSRRFWIKDMRRRLWWCTYSFDRLVGTCVGRPFGISDQVITTEMPSLLEDDYISPTGPLDTSQLGRQPSYKYVAHHYFRLRLLQSEILQVLQYNQAQSLRSNSTDQLYPEMHNHLPCAFLVPFDSFRSWRMSIDSRLRHWKNSAPTKQDTGVMFSNEFLELNYWQAIIMLYRQSLSTPTVFEGEYTTSEEMNSPSAYMAELQEDEDQVYLKVAAAGQKILRIYRQLHLSGLVSYTYLSTHHLFVAGISYLYAIWHSPAVRSHLKMDEVDFTVLAAKSVFTDLIEKCPPAETCRDAFDRTAKATIKMASSAGGFGNPQTYSQGPQQYRQSHTSWPSSGPETSASQARHHNRQVTEQAPFQFDLSLSDNLSSSGMSVSGGEMGQSPPIQKSNTLDSSGFMMIRHGMGDGSTGSLEGARGRDLPPIDPSLGNSPPLVRRVTTQATLGAGQGYINDSQQQMQPFGMQNTGGFTRSHDMDFLPKMEGSGEPAPLDPTQIDLGFGMGWDGLNNDYGENQHLNPFDTFFFGGQQGNAGGNGPGGNTGF